VNAPLLISGLALIAGITLLCDDIPGNDGFGWTFAGAGALGALISLIGGAA
jgi:hypothetical protein